MRAEPQKIEDFSNFDEIVKNWLPLTHALT